MSYLVDVVLTENYTASAVPHRLAGQTTVDGLPVARRVVVRDRTNFTYIASFNTRVDGLFEFEQLPSQTLAAPYTVFCYDDTPTKGNAQVFDYVYQVDDNGNPPQA